MSRIKTKIKTAKTITAYKIFGKTLDNSLTSCVVSIGKDLLKNIGVLNGL